MWGEGKAQKYQEELQEQKVQEQEELQEQEEQKLREQEEQEPVSSS